MILKGGVNFFFNIFFYFKVHYVYSKLDRILDIQQFFYGGWDAFYALQGVLNSHYADPLTSLEVLNYYLTLAMRKWQVLHITG